MAIFGREDRLYFDNRKGVRLHAETLRTGESKIREQSRPSEAQGNLPHNTPCLEMRFLLLLATLCSAYVLPLHALDALRAWHVTDLHLDPTYVQGSDAFDSCFCTTHEVSPYMMSAKCGMNGTALAFGTPEGNCATPDKLFESALDRVKETSVDYVLMTGDYGNAGLSSPMMIQDAKKQIVDVISSAFRRVRAAVPARVKVFGVLGNHDSSPGDVFTSAEDSRCPSSETSCLVAREVETHGSNICACFSSLASSPLCLFLSSCVFAAVFTALFFPHAFDSVVALPQPD